MRAAVVTWMLALMAGCAGSSPDPERLEVPGTEGLAPRTSSGSGTTGRGIAGEPDETTGRDDPTTGSTSAAPQDEDRRGPLPSTSGTTGAAPLRDPASLERLRLPA